MTATAPRSGAFRFTAYDLRDPPQDYDGGKLRVHFSLGTQRYTVRSSRQEEKLVAFDKQSFELFAAHPEQLVEIMLCSDDDTVNYGQSSIQCSDLWKVCGGESFEMQLEDDDKVFGGALRVSVNFEERKHARTSKAVPVNVKSAIIERSRFALSQPVNVKSGAARGNMSFAAHRLMDSLYYVQVHTGGYLCCDEQGKVSVCESKDGVQENDEENPLDTEWQVHGAGGSSFFLTSKTHQLALSASAAVFATKKAPPVTGIELSTESNRRGSITSIDIDGGGEAKLERRGSRRGLLRGDVGGQKLYITFGDGSNLSVDAKGGVTTSRGVKGGWEQVIFMEVPDEDDQLANL